MFIFTLGYLLPYIRSTLKQTAKLRVGLAVSVSLSRIPFQKPLTNWCLLCLWPEMNLLAPSSCGGGWWLTREQVCLCPRQSNPVLTESSKNVPHLKVFPEFRVFLWTQLQTAVLSTTLSMEEATQYLKWWNSMSLMKKKKWMNYRLCSSQDFAWSQLLEVNGKCWVKKSHFHMASRSCPWAFPWWNVKPQPWPLVFIKVLWGAYCQSPAGSRVTEIFSLGMTGLLSSPGFCCSKLTFSVRNRETEKKKNFQAMNYYLLGQAQTWIIHMTEQHSF